MIIDPYGPIREKGQLAIINYENNLQRMIIAVRSDEIHGTKGAWIFPVPGDPNEISIDVVKQVPIIYGQEILSTAKSYVDNLIRTIRNSQLYPLLFRRPIILTKGIELPGALEAAAIEVEYGQSVVVYEHIERFYYCFRRLHPWRFIFLTG